MPRKSRSSTPRSGGQAGARRSDAQPLSADLKTRILERIRGEYREMPGLTLTVEQARRLWSLDGQMCEEMLTTLVATGFLWRKPNGAYVRMEASELSVHPRMAKADLEPSGGRRRRQTKGGR